MGGEGGIHRFSIADYVVFALMLCISTCIGIYHACTGGKQKTAGEFLLADRNMGPIPVAMSLCASFMSAITVLGTPAEHYISGTMFSMFAVAYFFSMAISAELFMPVFYNLRITSIYEYLELRFKNKIIRILGCMTYLSQMFIYMGIAIYAPSLALNVVTGFSLWGSILACGIVCTFYTTIGGMKAVLWTDTFQLLVMFSGFLAVIIQASILLGGWSNIMDICEEGKRIEFFNFDPDPTVRHTVWSVCFGGIFTWVGIYGCNQAQVQRYFTCRTIKDAKIAIYLNIPGLWLVLSLSACSGLAMYAYYVDCDPLSAGYVSAPDQLMPYFVIDILGFLPGLAGVFVACLFSAALSTVSSGLNSLAAVTGEDIILQIWPNIDGKTYTNVTKILALSYGILSIIMAFVSSVMGSVLQAALSIFGMIGGPLLGLFSLAIFFPWANYMGAIVGLLTGLIISFWVGIGAFMYPPGRPRLPFSTAGCLNLTTVTTDTNTTDWVSSYFNESVTTTTTQDSYPPIADLYSLSYIYYGVLSWLIVVIVGLVVSFITGAQNPAELDANLISPCVEKCCCCLPASWKNILNCGLKKEQYQEQEKSPHEHEELMPNGCKTMVTRNGNGKTDVHVVNLSSEYETCL